ncbi:MAG TPA: SET domain-containing protein-lysine N-methyltransferase [Methylomirabilota bacterium]|nr:SET domain-containing protein-lysine N-methyltransferase [Methylomirabilota bacterium]
MVFVRQSDIHGTGVFADQVIQPGTRVLEYIGERVPKEEADRRCKEGNTFIFTINDEFDLDGDIEANVAKYINHSCEPNCYSELDEEQIFIIALRRIEVGEELTFNYGYDLKDYKDHPCKCGSKRCVGFMLAEEFFGKIA